MTVKDPAAFKANPTHSAAVTLSNSLRCPKCGHFHKYEPCDFPQCDCQPRAERPGHGPRQVIDMDELES